jgi:hypothetical protein
LELAHDSPLRIGTQLPMSGISSIWLHSMSPLRDLPRASHNREPPCPVRLLFPLQRRRWNTDSFFEYRRTVGNLSPLCVVFIRVPEKLCMWSVWLQHELTLCVGGRLMRNTSIFLSLSGDGTLSRILPRCARSFLISATVSSVATVSQVSSLPPPPAPLDLPAIAHLTVSCRGGGLGLN